MFKKVRLFFLLSLLAATSSYPQSRDKESLRGLHGVFLHVDPVGSDVEAGGFSTPKVQEAAERLFREAKIEIYSEPRTEEGSTNLIIIIDIVKHPQGICVFGIQVVLLQEVQLVRNKTANPIPAQTWTATAFGVTTPSRTDVILEPVKSKLGEFIGDFKVVNGVGTN